MLNQSKVALLSTLSRESPYLATMSLLYVMSKLIGKDFSIIYNHSKVEPQGKPTPPPVRLYHLVVINFLRETDFEKLCLAESNFSLGNPKYHLKTKYMGVNRVSTR